ncbi:palmitoyltransferase [Elysia marginata]|uniref:Palmitoyltransferase n=1 Tax=Elysia marginata TaxID=1093978 RepID=A0AAV4INM8_9GAST|nr:palmitoyltransferase [Elysia marginata]
MDAGILSGQHFSRAAAYQSGIGMDQSSPITPRPSASYNGPVQRPARTGDCSAFNMGVSKHDLSDPSLSLMDKFKIHYQGNKDAKRDLKSKHFFRLLFQFQAISQLYMTLAYIIPYVFSDYQDMTIYYLKVLACYVFAMGEANWLSAICYSNRLPDERDRPSLDAQELFETRSPQTLGQNFQQREEAHLRLSKTDKNGLEWKFCDKCQRYKPPRTHHCDVCRMCILRRDHHCFLIGTCIGHFNQRYFIPFCFLGIVTSVVGFFITVVYIRSLPDGRVWGDYVFPWALIKLVLGQVSWRFCLLTFHSMMLLVFGFMCVIYGTGQLSIVALGVTLYEVAKQIDVKVTSSTAENMRIVFGDYWLVNFLFPGQILFKQRHDGIHWDNIKFGPGPQVEKVSVE